MFMSSKTFLRNVKTLEILIKSYLTQQELDWNALRAGIIVKVLDFYC